MHLNLSNYCRQPDYIRQPDFGCVEAIEANKSEITKSEYLLNCFSVKTSIINWFIFNLRKRAHILFFLTPAQMVLDVKLLQHDQT